MSVSTVVVKKVQKSLHQKAYVPQKVKKLWFKQVLELCNFMSSCPHSPHFLHTYTLAHTQHTSTSCPIGNVICSHPLSPSCTVHPSQEPGWLEGTLNGKTGLIPENYVEFL